MISGVQSGFDCRCPEKPPRPEIGEMQLYCGKELKGLDCLPESIYRCNNFQQKIATFPVHELDDNCGHEFVQMFCGPFRKECKRPRCYKLRKCYHAQESADDGFAYWYGTQNWKQNLTANTQDPPGLVE